MKTKALFVLLVFFTATNAMSQGITGGQFLEIGVGSRACAMGEAYTAIADDPSAVYWNPAGLSRMNAMDVMFSHNFWLLDMSMQYFSAILPTPWGNFGLGLCYSSSGSIPQIEDFIKTGEYTAYDAVVSLSFARQLPKAVSVGISAKTILSQIEKVQASTYALDIGLLYDVSVISGLHLGINVQNIGPGMTFIEQTDPLPLCIRAGAGYNWKNLTMGLSMNDYLKGENDVGMGGEYLLLKVLALRLGYNTRSSISGGVGLVYRNLYIGYTVMQFRDIGFSHLISLRVKGI
jgi:hypothetical protein